MPASAVESIELQMSDEGEDPNARMLSHQAFEQSLSPYLDQAVNDTGTQSPGVLACIDLLFFDVIYRVGGIETVNRMQSDFVACLRDVLGDDIIIGRLENNCLAVMIPNVSVHELQDRFDQLKTRSQDISAASIDGEIQLNYSIGLTVVNGVTWDPSELVFEAITACQVATELGPYSMHTYEPAESEDSDFHRVVLWIPRLQQAMDGQTMTLHQQPIVPIQEGSSLPPLREYLVRVPDDAGRPVDAASFIDIAEKYRFIGRIDRWVIGKAITLLRRGVGADRRTFVNLSAHSLQDPTFLSFVLELLSDSEIDGSLLGFEVTECSEIRDVDTAASFLRSMKDRGCQIALDDFGTGYSSLQHLKRLPVDMIKLDGEFVRGLPDDPMSLAIIEAAVRFANATQKLVVAEFVENPTILASIREMGIDYGQGYELARPAAVEQDHT